MKFSLTQSFLSPVDLLSAAIEVNEEETLAQDVPFPASAETLVIELTGGLDPTKCSALLLLADQNCNVAGFDDADASHGVIALMANVPFLFVKGTNPAVDLTDIIDATITKLSLENTSDPLAAGTLKVRAAIDPTA